MSTPTDDMKDTVSMVLFGKKRSDCIAKGECVTCDDPDMKFRDTLSHKEWTISGMCQKCQDLTFGGDDE